MFFLFSPWKLRGESSCEVLTVSAAPRGGWVLQSHRGLSRGMILTRHSSAFRWSWYQALGLIPHRKRQKWVTEQRAGPSPAHGSQLYQKKLYQNFTVHKGPEVLCMGMPQSPKFVTLAPPAEPHVPAVYHRVFFSSRAPNMQIFVRGECLQNAL